METPEFKDFAHSMVDFIGDYLDNIRDRWVYNNNYYIRKVQRAAVNLIVSTGSAVAAPLVSISSPVITSGAVA
jgi:hypothetical protein